MERNGSDLEISWSQISLNVIASGTEVSMLLAKNFKYVRVLFKNNDINKQEID